MKAATQLEMEDRERVRFLKRLDDSDRVTVTDWEAQFIESFLTAPRGFTPAQRDKVDQMRRTYGHLI